MTTHPQWAKQYIALSQSNVETKTSIAFDVMSQRPTRRRMAVLRNLYTSMLISNLNQTSTAFVSILKILNSSNACYDLYEPSHCARSYRVALGRPSDITLPLQPFSTDSMVRFINVASATPFEYQADKKSSSWNLNRSILSCISAENHCRNDPVQVQSTEI